MIRTVLFAGSREWKWAVTVRSYGDKALIGMGPGDKLVVIHGDHHAGADRIIRTWAEEARARWQAAPDRFPEVAERRYTVTREEWRAIGSSAGPRRNARMVAENRDAINYAYFFVLDPDQGKSRGTLGCLELVQDARIKHVKVVDYTSRQLPRTGRADPAADLLREGRP